VPDGDFADAGEVRYGYDGNGRRISKDFAGGAASDEVTYYNESWQELETRKGGSSSAYTQQVWSPRYVDAAIVRYRNADGSGTTGSLGMEEAMLTTYDANYNVTGLVQETQSFVERYVYTPYGDRKVLEANFADDPDNLTDFDQQRGHQGLRIDAESGTYYNRARQLHSGLGSFMRRDPQLTNYQDGLNLYQVYRGNPVKYADPSGAVCVLAIRCGSVAGGLGQHCGLYISDSLGTTYIDGRGGNVNTFALSPAAWAGSKQGRPVTLDDETCQCIRTSITKWNALAIPRNNLVNNSNWSLRCLLRKCDLSIDFSPHLPAENDDMAIGEGIPSPIDSQPQGYATGFTGTRDCAGSPTHHCPPEFDDRETNTWTSFKAL
jgi:RHS repeat-associated protein